MIVIPPIKITDSKLTSSTISEPDTGETAWNSATNYTLGQVVIRTTTHRKYENQIAGVDSGLPENTPNRWLDVGPTNKWAMFDQLGSFPTEVAAGNLTVVITPGQRVNALALIGVQAKQVNVKVTSGVTEVYNKTLVGTSRVTTTWSQYFFGVFGYRSTLVFDEIPYVSNAVVTIQFSNDAGSVKCSGVVLGMSSFIGHAQYNAKSDSLNFSKIERDEFGNSVLLPKRTVPRIQVTTYTEKNLVNLARNIRKDLNAVPAFWSSLDDRFDDPYFESLAIYGIYKQFEIDIAHPSVAYINLELEEL